MPSYLLCYGILRLDDQLISSLSDVIKDYLWYGTNFTILGQFIYFYINVKVKQAHLHTIRHLGYIV